MARLLTAVDEAVADQSDKDPFSWLTIHKGEYAPSSSGDRFLLFLGLDAGRKQENSIDQMLVWFSRFEKTALGFDSKRFAATVFVLDWPKGIKDHAPALRDDKDVDRLMEAGLYYRLKDPEIYGNSNRSLRDALVMDLMASHLIPELPEMELSQAVDPREAPEDEAIYRENAEFLGSQQMVWPKDTIERLLKR